VLKELLIGRWRRWRPTAAPAIATITHFTDATVERLRGLQQERAEVTRRLDRHRPVWDRLQDRPDPGAHQERGRLAPLITDDEARLRDVDQHIEEAEARIRATAAKAQAYAHLTIATDAWFAPLVDRLPSDEELARCYHASRQLDRAASELLARTGDRQFRRSAVDPYGTVREALADRLRALERLRLLRSSVAS